MKPATILHYAIDTGAFIESLNRTFSDRCARCGGSLVLVDANHYGEPVTDVLYECDDCKAQTIETRYTLRQECLHDDQVVASKTAPALIVNVEAAGEGDFDDPVDWAIRRLQTMLDALKAAKEQAGV